MAMGLAMTPLLARDLKPPRSIGWTFKLGLFVGRRETRETRSGLGISGFSSRRGGTREMLAATTLGLGVGLRVNSTLALGATIGDQPQAFPMHSNEARER
jgi:hypothetical protein